MKTKVLTCRILLCWLLVACTLLCLSCNRLPFGSFQQNTPDTEEENGDTSHPSQETQKLEGELLPEVNVFCYGESIASGNVLYAYKTIKTAVARTVPAATIEFDRQKKLTADELSLAVALFASDHPECFWFKQAYSYASLGDSVVECTPEYNFTGKDLKKAREAMDAAINLILSGLPVRQADSTNAYQIALYLHDALANHTEYKEVGYHQSAYGALVDGQAVCAGYAAAYQLLLQKAGIPAYTVIGTSIDPSGALGDQPVAHAWNAVWLSDGVCVFTDVTWDDSPDHIYHHYFNLSFEEMEQDHSANPQSFHPISCNHTSYGYFDHNPRTVVNDLTTAKEIAPLFRQNGRGIYVATFYYEGTKGFLSWFNPLANELTLELTGKPNASTLRWVNKGNEYQVQLEMKHIWSS